MGRCNIDHSKESVGKKLDNQSDFLPEDLKNKIETFLAKDQTQAILNEVFHLLKKYDLASDEERLERDKAFHDLMDNA